MYRVTTLKIDNEISSVRTATIIGLIGDELTLASAFELTDDVRAAFVALDASTKRGSVTKVVADGQVIIGVGLGTEPELEDLRSATGDAIRAAAGLDEVDVAIAHDTIAELEAIAEGALFAAYDFTAYKKPKKTAVASITVVSPVNGSTEDIAKRAEIVRDAIFNVRDFVNTSPSDLNPASFAEAARTAAEDAGCSVKIFDGEDLVRENLAGLIAVGQGSKTPPRLVRIEWNPDDAQGFTALVGKGITYDSGGYSIKPATSMVTMKTDMTGAATVLETTIATARLGVPRKVVAWMCLAENMVDAHSTRPDDVITYRNGTSVEINNTDAEGRVVMADGLIMATEEQPDEVIDIATLTGAQILALGPRTSGVMGTDSVREAIVEAADAAGEAAWGMPLPEHLRESLDSDVADIRNSGARQGGMLVAGLYLKEFVGDTPWGHIDIAGPSFNESSAYGYTPKGATGVMVRTLLTHIESEAEKPA